MQNSRIVAPKPRSALVAENEASKPISREAPLESLNEGSAICDIIREVC